jgi:hypothetical protein
MKRSLMTIGPEFCATRMMNDYLHTMYQPMTAESLTPN